MPVLHCVTKNVAPKNTIKKFEKNSKRQTTLTFNFRPLSLLFVFKRKQDVF